MIKLTQPIIVEGKYDKITLENVVDTLIIPTNGFSIFKDKEKCELIRILAQKDGVIVLTDSDSAGGMIRSHIKNIVNGGKVINVYVPQLKGKEKRKSAYSKEGLLGVEGMPRQVIEQALRQSGVFGSAVSADAQKITKMDLYEHGLTGGENSRKKRELLLKSLSLPIGLSTNVMLDVLNTLFTFEQFETAVKKCQNPGDKS